MPRKSKQPKKIKNIIQSVVVNISDHKKTTSKRKRRQPKKKATEAVDIMARIPPTIVYQSPSVNLPSQFTPQPQQIPFSVPVTKTLVETIEIPKSEPLSLPSKRETLESLGDVVHEFEFAPTANFISEKDRINSQLTSDKVYTEEPFSQSSVQGNTKFGEEESVLSQKSSEEEEEEEYIFYKKPEEKDSIIQPKPKKIRRKITQFDRMNKIELQQVFRKKLGEPMVGNKYLTKGDMINMLKSEYNL